MNKKAKLSLWDLVVLVTSFFSIVLLFIQISDVSDPNVFDIVRLSDNIVCFVFLADVFVNHKKDPGYFKKWGWFDLISSIPFLGYARVGRVVRLFRIIRLLRGFRSIKIIWKVLSANRRSSVATILVLFISLSILGGGIAVLEFENGNPNSNISSPKDAIWWAFVTITTVGYGDYFPVTIGGRIVSTFLMIVGIGVFGSVSALVASTIIQFEDSSNCNQEYENICKSLKTISERLSKIEDKLDSLR